MKHISLFFIYAFLSLLIYDNKQQATSYNMASTTATDMARTFKTLDSYWKTKSGRRDHTVSIFNNTTPNEPKSHIPFLLINLFNKLHKEHGDFVTLFKNVNPSNVKLSHDNSAIWIYSMRQSDALPKTTEDTCQLYAFVRIFLEQHLYTNTYAYMMKHINIAVYFFIWFFTTPDFFYNKTEIKQTTRNGVRKVWRSILLIKSPTAPINNSASNHINGVQHQNNILSKLESQKQNIISNINNIIISVHPQLYPYLDWDDDIKTRMFIAETMQIKHKHYINGKKQKKIQKLYQDLQKINDKIKTSNKSIRKEHKNIPLTIKTPDINSYDWGDFGPPPEPPKLVRQYAQIPGIETTIWSSSEGSDDELDIPLPIHTPNKDDDVPDSWEDL